MAAKRARSNGNGTSASKRRSTFQKKRTGFRSPNPRTGGFIGMELKFLDTFLSNHTVVETVAGSEIDMSSGSQLCLNAIAQGDGESNRDGRKCVLKSVQVRGKLHLATQADVANAEIGETCRILLVWDKQTNGAQLNSEDVLLDGSGVDLLSLRNLQYSQRFQVLAEEMVDLQWSNSQTDGTNTASVGGEAKHFEMFRKLNIPVVHTGTTGVVASISDNSLHLIAIAAGADITLSYQARVRFVG